MRSDQLGQHRVAVVRGGQHAVDAEKKEGGAVERIHFRMNFTVAARPLELTDQQHDHGMVGPLVFVRPCRREVERQ
jgi:hypothetical protein